MPGEPNKHWTQEGDDELRRLWDSGLSTKRIGEAMGITKNAAIGRSHRIGLKPRASPLPLAAQQKPKRPRQVVLHTELPPPPLHIEPRTPPGCQWPMWEDYQPTPHPALFCGQPVRTRGDGLPCWCCPTHAQRAFIHVPKPSETRPWREFAR